MGKQIFKDGVLADQLRVCLSRKDWEEGEEGMEGEWYSGGQWFWWVMVPKSTGFPAAAVGLWGRGAVLTIYTEYRGSSRMGQDMVSSLEQSS